MPDAQTAKRGKWHAPETGSRRWFWNMRVANMTLWILPVMPIAYMTGSQRKHDWHGAMTVFYVWAPWVFFTVMLALTSRAIWRTEVNLAANKSRPFTPKDRKALRWASAASVGTMTYAVLMSFKHPSGMSKDDWSDVGDGLTVIMIASLIVSILTASMERMHCKASHAYEELEKGV